jgi:hypothetical protein
VAVSTTIKVAGVKDAINQLRKIDPELQNQFKRDAKAIAQPAIDAAKAAYSVLENNQHPYALSGMGRNWQQGGRKLFPFKLNKAINGVVMKFDTRRNAVGVISIMQKDIATAVFETAGRVNTNKLGAALGFVGRDQTRILKPAIEKNIEKVELEIEKIVKAAMRTVQKAL